MTAEEYKTELKAMYGMAIKNGDIHIALEILERGRAMGVGGISDSKLDGKDS